MKFTTNIYKNLLFNNKYIVSTRFVCAEYTFVLLTKNKTERKDSFKLL